MSLCTACAVPANRSLHVLLVLGLPVQVCDTSCDLGVCDVELMEISS